MSEEKEELMDGVSKLTSAVVQEVTIGDVKHWYKSKTIWGGVVAVGAGVAGLFGFHLDATLQQTIVDYGASLVSAFGGGMAIYGRLKATATIGKAGS
jgi:hypothetical protein